MTFPADCVQVIAGQRIVFKENNRSFCLLNAQRVVIRKVHIDGCLIPQSDRQRACDYGAWIDSQSKAYFIELKGKNIQHAVRQIIASINFVQQNHMEECEGKALEAVIVSSKNHAPNLKQSPDYIKLKSMLHQKPHIKTNYLELPLS
ncbi:hypothetical protein LGV61_12490 [Desulfurispirillum indicum]|uniref:hypothetical protein n=1 Tax=Desulfurispirillum indicum TaxID=936456 RepID=UPI001CF979BE|nr:hypothetical protein [Desulfurispirillum indicum]UCZ56530.1 hypothetical protein LGV61_12490 [Desulfurispirillum indicum]